MSTSTPEDLLKNAEKKASAVSGWFSSVASKQEEAIELFKAAANKFRISNRFEEAGNAYMRAAETELKTGEKDYAANTFFEANKCFRMSRPELAVVALTRAREILIERGRFRQAADREKAVAELLKGDANDPERSLEAYEQAAAWYLQEGANATASGCYREAAMLATDLARFPQAIERWEQVATMSLESNLTRYSVKDYYLNAGMCYLAIPVSFPPSPLPQTLLDEISEHSHIHILTHSHCFWCDATTGLRSSSPRNAVLRRTGRLLPHNHGGPLPPLARPGLRRGGSASLRRARSGIRPHQENSRLAGCTPSGGEEGHSGRAGSVLKFSTAM